MALRGETEAVGQGGICVCWLALVVVTLAIMAPLFAIGAVIVRYLWAPLSNLGRALFAFALVGGAGFSLAGLSVDRNRLWFRRTLDCGLPALLIYPFTHSLASVASALTAGAILLWMRAP